MHLCIIQSISLPLDDDSIHGGDDDLSVSARGTLYALHVSLLDKHSLML